MRNRPLVFVDLDDTLFQTARKMDPKATGMPVSFLADGQPSGFMTPVQDQFAAWLLEHADVVPVTARSAEVYRRVNLPFSHGAIVSNGAVMLGLDNETPDVAWAATMVERLAPYQERLARLSDFTLSAGASLGYDLRGWVVEENGLAAYVVTKYNAGRDEQLAALADLVEGAGELEGFYVHRNGNNLAFIPNPLSKRFAVLEKIARDRQVHGERPILGFGDSLSDLAFMRECHWFAVPANSQIANHLQESL
jgi:hydroxymethylpyrimidine pyrophosphatase-like HAD family hydrolase